MFKLKTFIIISIFLSFLLIKTTFSLQYPYIYLQENEFGLIENSNITYYEKLANITHEGVYSMYSVDINGNPIYERNGVTNRFSVVLINDTSYKSSWNRYEFEDITKFNVNGIWNVTTLSGAFNNTILNSSIIYNTIDFNFYGSAIGFTYYRCNSCGYLNVYVNDTLYSQIDTYASRNIQTYTSIYISQYDDWFNVKFEVGDLKNPSSSNYNVMLDTIVFGSSYYKPYILDKIYLIDNKTITLQTGSATANYLKAGYYLGNKPGVYIVNQTFYLYVRNPTSSFATIGIADDGTYNDAWNGTSQSLTGRPYCVFVLPPNTDWTLIRLGVENTSSGMCALQWNATHAGLRRSYAYSTSYDSIAPFYRVYTNTTGVELDSFFVGIDREIPNLYVKNAITNNDVKSYGWINCDDIRGVNKGVNITIDNMIGNGASWTLYMITPFGDDYTFYTFNSTGVTANASGVVVLNNWRDTSNRLCADYDYANTFMISLRNTLGTAGSSSGALYRINTPVIFATPWNWSMPEIKIIDLDTGKEEYILRPNKRYEFQMNMTRLDGSSITSGITPTISFIHLYGTEVLEGYENPIYLDGNIQFSMASDSQITLYYNANKNLWVRNFTTPTEWKYSGHLSALRIRITNTTNSTYRIRFSSLYTGIPTSVVMFSNHQYSNNKMDIVKTDLDFGLSSNNYFYTTSGGAYPSINDGVNDIYIEDENKVILIYNSPENYYTQTPIVIYHKKLKEPPYFVSSATSWAPGYTYFGSYRQNRYVDIDSNLVGLSKDYVVLNFTETNAIGYRYNTYMYLQADSDVFDINVEYPEYNSYDYSYFAINYPIRTNMYTGSYISNFVNGLQFSNRLPSATGWCVGNTRLSGLTSTINFFNILDNPYMLLTTTIPMPAEFNVKGCYPYCFDFKTYKYFENYENNIALNSQTRNKFGYVLGTGVLYIEGRDNYEKSTNTIQYLNYNLGNLINAYMKKFKVRYIHTFDKLENNENDYGFLIKQLNDTFGYGYVNSYSKESIDIGFNKKSKIYDSGETIDIKFIVRNSTKLEDKTFNYVVLDEEGNIVYQGTLQSTNGLANKQMVLQKSGVYKIYAYNNEYKGLGFVWIRGISQKIETDKLTYAKGENVKISSIVYDTASNTKLEANIICNLYNPFNVKTNTITLGGDKEEYYAYVFINQTASEGQWRFNCNATSGSVENIDNVYFFVAGITTENQTTATYLQQINQTTIQNQQLINDTNATTINYLSNLNQNISSIYNISKEINETSFKINNNVVEINNTINIIKLNVSDMIISKQKEHTLYLSDFKFLTIGENYSVKLFVIDYENKPKNLVELPQITILNSTKDIVFNDYMTQEETGMYSYTVQINNESSLGIYETIIKVKINNNYVKLTDFWNVLGYLADVNVLDIIDKEPPEIIAKVYIKNVGNGGSDFVIKYCIVEREDYDCTKSIISKIETVYVGGGVELEKQLKLSSDRIKLDNIYYFKVYVRTISDTKWAVSYKQFKTEKEKTIIEIVGEKTKEIPKRVVYEIVEVGEKYKFKILYTLISIVFVSILIIIIKKKYLNKKK